VDAREQRWIRKLVQPLCTSTCADNIYLASKHWDEPPFRYNGTDRSADGIVKYVARIGGESPRQISDMAAVKKLETMDKVTILGIFHTEKDAEALGHFKAVAQKNRMDYFFGLATEATIKEGKLGAFIQDATTANKVRLKESPSTARVVVIKQFKSSKARDAVAVFGHRETDVFTEESIMSFVKASQGELVAMERTDAPLHKKRSARGAMKHVGHLWLKTGSDEHKAGVLATVRQVAQQYHRDMLFVVHDEKKETTERMWGKNVSKATADSLLPFGLDGANRPLFGIQSYPMERTETGETSYAFEAFNKDTSRGELSEFCKTVMKGGHEKALRSEAASSSVTGPAHRLAGVQMDQFMATPTEKLLRFHHTFENDWKDILASVVGALDVGGVNIDAGYLDVDKNELPPTQSALNEHATTSRVVFVSKSGAVTPVDTSDNSIPAMVRSVLALTEAKVDQALAESCAQRSEKLLGGCKVTLHEHSELNGWQASFTRGVYDVDAMTLRGARNDDASSVEVEEGCSAMIFEHTNSTGWSVRVRPGRHKWHDLEKMGMKNDAASALVVEPYLGGDSQPDLCEIAIKSQAHNGCGGSWSALLTQGRWNHTEYERRGGVQDEEAVVMVPQDCKVVVYENSDFTGWSQEFGPGSHTIQQGVSAISIEGPPEPAPSKEEEPAIGEEEVPGSAEPSTADAPDSGLPTQEEL